MLIGSVVGYFGGTVDTIVMRLIDILQAIPGILLAIAISACLGSGLFNTVLAHSDDGTASPRFYHGGTKDGIY